MHYNHMQTIRRNAKATAVRPCRAPARTQHSSRCAGAPFSYQGCVRSSGVLRSRAPSSPRHRRPQQARRASRAASAALATLRTSLLRCARRAPGAGSPCGTGGAATRSLSCGYDSDSDDGHSGLRRKRSFDYVPLAVTVFLILLPHPSLLHILIRYHLRVLIIGSRAFFAIHFTVLCTLAFLAFYYLLICAARDPDPVSQPEPKDGSADDDHEMSFSDALLVPPEDDDYCSQAAGAASAGCPSPNGRTTVRRAAAACSRWVCAPMYGFLLHTHPGGIYRRLPSP
jgi:hypothetical protein